MAISLFSLICSFFLLSNYSLNFYKFSEIYNFCVSSPLCRFVWQLNTVIYGLKRSVVLLNNQRRHRKYPHDPCMPLSVILGTCSFISLFLYLFLLKTALVAGTIINFKKIQHLLQKPQWHTWHNIPLPGNPMFNKTEELLTKNEIWNRVFPKFCNSSMY